MAQFTSSHDEKTDTFTGVPAFWPKPTAKPSMLWKDWLVRFYLAADLKDGGYTRDLCQDCQQPLTLACSVKVTY